ncbi:serine/threonine-protein kinase bud32 [Orbilia oligospora]|uniref:EKC/KEOPS complex subunit BUD32 n=1 Tax=Orbilia oligospora TaxID=2813651 RepID=A0A7C8NYM9_ORBOL|nr:serine/threonine-protein kinase bud32 [Orbilia oligospora]KAF3167311.1 serine/threonine-protein kinase bud32 [Orbilia oligospora]KAF3240006.1 serine/threonine-protein kinase bud32 [Orbilia oligospora]KAF3269383.1 serine/threonine-protein kinase bud32 [Orbilia oligospora]KAF3269384.1 serine/threonine-protein kinase bud32, variant 2 [Orbilia oligospora]
MPPLRLIDGALVKQGAEAHVYKSTFLYPNVPCLIKVRPTKPYRHATLDMRLTKHRCISEARLLNRCRSMGVLCPAVYFVDEKRGEIIMEWIEGPSVRDFLHNYMDDASDPGKDENKAIDVRLDALMENIGQTIGKLHDIDTIHGDLTTSNLMLKLRESPGTRILDTADTSLANSDVVLIDFGLGQVSSSDEDKAVDLYVLERAFLSTHPRATRLFDIIIDSYKRNCLGSSVVLRRLQEVRLRGRKKSMVG